MKACSIEKLRNFAVVGHTNSGKTSLCELMLNKAGAISRLGSINEGNTVSDFRKDEQDRRGSISSSLLNCIWNDHQFFFSDNPGYADFFGETCTAIEAADMALIVIDGSDGIGPGTTRAWKIAQEDQVPCAFFINGMDKPGSHYMDILLELKEAYGKLRVIPMVMPIGRHENLTKVVHILRTPENDIPADFKEAVLKDRQQLIDTIAEADDALMDRYLNGETLSDMEIAQGLHAAVVKGLFIPVFCGSVAKDVGVTELMNGIVNLFPSELDANPFVLNNGDLVERKVDDPEGLAWIFKSVNDPHIGQISYIRIISGTWKSNEVVYNVNQGMPERLGVIHSVRGKSFEELDFAIPGAIVAVLKLKNSSVGDTLSLKQGTVHRMPDVKYPVANMIQAVRPANKGDDEKLATALHKLCMEDPTLVFKRHEETGEELLYGMGDQHFSIVRVRLKNEFKLEVAFETPKIPYRETISATASAAYRHKKQSGGHGQFAEVHLKLEPNENGFEFCNAIVGGVIPKNYIPAVEKGVIEAMEKGPLAHCRVIKVKATVFDGKQHDVDSSEMAFKIATRMAFREAMRNAKPILLEPIRKIKIYTPDVYMGDISGDLNTRRARILGMGVENAMQVIEAEIPLAETFNYSTQLRSMTQGKGFYEIEPLRYDVVPSIISQKIQATIATIEETEEI